MVSWVSLAAKTLGAIGKYSAEKEQYRARRHAQDYNNTMLRLSSAMSSNTITDNAIANNAAFDNQTLNTNKGNILTNAQIAVASAAAGVKGKSVNDVLLDSDRFTAESFYANETAIKQNNLSEDTQRRQLAFNVESSTDRSFIVKPKLGTYLLDVVASTNWSSERLANNNDAPRESPRANDNFVGPMPRARPAIDWESPASLKSSVTNRYF